MPNYITVPVRNQNLLRRIKLGQKVRLRLTGKVTSLTLPGMYPECSCHDEEGPVGRAEVYIDAPSLDNPFSLMANDEDEDGD